LTRADAHDAGLLDAFFSPPPPEPVVVFDDADFPRRRMSAEARRAMLASLGIFAGSVLAIGGFLAYQHIAVPEPVELGSASAVLPIDSSISAALDPAASAPRFTGVAVPALQEEPTALTAPSEEPVAPQPTSPEQSALTPTDSVPAPSAEQAAVVAPSAPDVLPAADVAVPQAVQEPAALKVVVPEPGAGEVAHPAPIPITRAAREPAAPQPTLQAPPEPGAVPAAPTVRNVGLEAAAANVIPEAAEGAPAVQPELAAPDATPRVSASNTAAASSGSVVSSVPNMANVPNPAEIVAVPASTVVEPSAPRQPGPSTAPSQLAAAPELPAPDAAATADRAPANQAPAQPGFNELVAAARGFERTGKHVQAVETYDRALVLRPGAADALAGKAHAHLNLNQHTTAKQFATLAVAADSTNSLGWIVLGAVEDLLGARAAAQQAYRSCAEQGVGDYVVECRRLAR
jgi:hypothetical protein